MNQAVKTRTYESNYSGENYQTDFFYSSSSFQNLRFCVLFRYFQGFKIRKSFIQKSQQNVYFNRRLCSMWKIPIYASRTPILCNCKPMCERHFDTLLRISHFPNISRAWNWISEIRNYDFPEFRTRKITFPRFGILENKLFRARKIKFRVRNSELNAGKFLEIGKLDKSVRKSVPKCFVATVNRSPVSIGCYPLHTRSPRYQTEFQSCFYRWLFPGFGILEKANRCRKSQILRKWSWIEKFCLVNLCALIRFISQWFYSLIPQSLELTLAVRVHTFQNSGISEYWLWKIKMLLIILYYESVKPHPSRGIIHWLRAVLSSRNKFSTDEKSGFSKLRNYKFRTSEFRNPINNKCPNISSASFSVYLACCGVCGFISCELPGT